jgi:hypothetical protein
MKNAETRFKELIRKLKYSQIQLFDVNATKIQYWCKKYIPEIYNQLEPLEWNLTKDSTWFETVLTNTFVMMYTFKVGLYITYSYTDWLLAEKVFATKAFAKFRKDFNLDYQVAVLLNPYIFIKAEELDLICLNLSSYAIDLSHFNEVDELDEDVKEEYSFLEYSLISKDDILEYEEWTPDQIHKINTWMK